MVFNVKNWSREILNSDSLIKSVDELFVLLENQNIKYTVTGGIALLNYIEARNSEVIELIVCSIFNREITRDKHHQ